MKRLSLVVVASLLVVSVIATSAAYAQVPKQAFTTFKLGGIHSGTCDFPGQVKELHVYGSHINEFYTAVEYRTLLCTCLVPLGVSYSTRTVVTNGNPWTGVQQAFFPPVNGFFPGLDLWATVFATCSGTCGDCGVDQPVIVGPEPVSGFLQGTRNDAVASKFQMLGLTTILCPAAVGTQESSWGKVKALYQESQ